MLGPAYAKGVNAWADWSANVCNLEYSRRCNDIILITPTNLESFAKMVLIDSSSLQIFCKGCQCCLSDQCCQICPSESLTALCQCLHSTPAICQPRTCACETIVQIASCAADWLKDGYDSPLAYCVNCECSVNQHLSAFHNHCSQIPETQWFQKVQTWQESNMVKIIMFTLTQGGGTWTAMLRIVIIHCLEVRLWLACRTLCMQARFLSFFRPDKGSSQQTVEIG